MRTWLTALGMLVFLAGGCVESTSPVLTDTQVTAPGEWVGKWVQTDDSKPSTLVVGPASPDKSCPVQFTDSDGKKGSLIGRLGKVSDLTVVELRADPSDVDKLGDYEKGLLLPLYYGVVIHRTDADHATGEAMDYDWFKKYIADHPTELQTAKIKDDFVVTASTEDFQKFLIKHLKDDGAMKQSIWKRAGPDTQSATAPSAG